MKDMVIDIPRECCALCGPPVPRLCRQQCETGPSKWWYVCVFVGLAAALLLVRPGTAVQLPVCRPLEPVRCRLRGGL